MMSFKVSIGIKRHCSERNSKTKLLCKEATIKHNIKMYGGPYWTLFQTFPIYAQLQIYLLNFTLSILIAIFSCQIPTTYAMFYKKVSCVLIQYGQLYVPYGMMHRASGFCKIAPRPLLAIFAEAKNGGSMLYSRLRE